MGSLNITEGGGFFFIVALLIGLIAYPKLVFSIFGMYLGMLSSVAVGAYLGAELAAKVFGKGTPLNLIGAVFGIAIGWKLFFFFVDKLANGSETDE